MEIRKNNAGRRTSDSARAMKPDTEHTIPFPFIFLPRRRAALRTSDISKSKYRTKHTPCDFSEISGKKAGFHLHDL
ncbi:MAG TPA: hypothetical protein ENO00_00750 [Deltaproteobacteria bacterium]|nr:hypothetical protein [Deltaproteobacteria bacterium]